MKKILVIFASIILVSSCNFDWNLDNTNTLKNSKTANLDNVSALFIINPTAEDKPLDEKWISISETSSRNVINDINDGTTLSISKNYVEHTRPFTYDASLFTLKTSNSNRSASDDTVTTVRTQRFKVGEKHIFSDNDLMGGDRTGRLKFEGESCYIWTLINEDSESLMDMDEIEVFAAKFDELYAKQTAICGPKYDGTNRTGYEMINPNKKISVLLFDIQNDKDQGNLLGYFAPANYFVDQQDGKNQIELLCVDSYFAKHEDYAAGVYSTLVHEFNHMLNFANKTLKYGLSMDTWYTEMLSMLTEDVFEEDLDVDYANSILRRLELFVQGGYVCGFKNWPEITDTDDIVYFKYSNAYAFGAFLARNYGGAKLFHEIATNEYTNEESIVEAVNTINGTELSFEDLLKDFCLILVNPSAESKSAPSLYKEVNKKVGDYYFTFSKIDLNNLSLTTDVEITPITSTSRAVDYLAGYGFHFYKYEEQKDLKLRYKDFLLCEYY